MVVFGAAPWVADFYSEPRMRDLLWLAAFNFLLLPFSTISLALLRRRLAFKALAIVNLVATRGRRGDERGPVMGGLRAAWASWPVRWWSAQPRGSPPGGPRASGGCCAPGCRQWRSLFKFGAQSSLVGVVTSVSMDINDLAVGKLMGFTPVAMLSRAQGLMNLFHRDLMGAVRNVAYPVYAKADAREPGHGAACTSQA